RNSRSTIGRRQSRRRQRVRESGHRNLGTGQAARNSGRARDGSDQLQRRPLRGGPGSTGPEVERAKDSRRGGPVRSAKREVSSPAARIARQQAELCGAVHIPVGRRSSVVYAV